MSFRAKIKVLATDREKYKKFDGKMFETSVGSFFSIVFCHTDFSYVNDEMTQEETLAFVDEIIMHYGIDTTPPMLDKIKNFGFKYSTVSGTTWGLDNVICAERKGQQS